MTAALALAAAASVSCSVLEDPVADRAPESQMNVYTLVATLSPEDSGVGTRSVMTDNGTTISTSWEVGDKIWVNYEDTGNNNRTARGEVTEVDASGKATITVDLVNPKDASDIGFGFPYDHYTEAKDVRLDQVGSLDDICLNHAALYGGGTLSVSGTDVTLPASVPMGQELCIWKLNFTDGVTDFTDQITSLNISFGPLDDYMVTPVSQNPIYVALYPVAGNAVTITAATATGLYSYTKASITLDDGKFYRSEVALSPAAANDTYRVFTSRTNYSDEDIPAGATIVTSGTTTWGAGTYVVSGNVTINANVSVPGAAHLILKDDASLTVNGQIQGNGSLSVYGQTLGTGKLDVVSNDISVSVGSLAIHGGVITVTEGGVMQGLEAYESLDIYHGTVTTAGDANGFMIMGDMHIYGGNVTCSAVHGGALSIYGAGTHHGSLTVSGGTFTANAAGAGNYGIDATDGYGKGLASIVFSGGTILVSGGASDNTNSGGNAIDVCGTLTISGNANVTANGGTDAFDMGGGYGINVRAGTEAGGSAMINGGTVTATSGPGGMAAINIDGDLTISGATTQIEATGGDMGEGILAYGNITIEGGTVSSSAGEMANGLEGDITVNGGKVTAVGGDATAGSGTYGFSGINGSLAVNGGIVTATGGAGDGGADDGLGVDGATIITLGAGIVMYEGDSANPTTEAADQSTCTKRFVRIQ